MHFILESAEFRGKIDLIYIDPPFDICADFSMQVPIGGQTEILEKEQSTLEMIAYRDIWGQGIDSYLSMMYGRWIMSDLGRFAIHTSRKRLIELQRNLHSDGKPYRAFDVYKLGRYERQWWQQDRLKGADEAHRQVVLEFFRAEVLTSAPWPLIHGRKGGAFCHIDGIDSMFTRDEAKAVAQAVAQAGGGNAIASPGNLKWTCT
jgi:hypothetical protein